MLTREQAGALGAPLPLETGHEVRIAEVLKGGTRARWLVYTTEGPVVQRLSEVDPAWELSVQQILVLEGSVSVATEITVCGTTRTGVGGASPKGGGAEVDGDIVKAAATDSFKRAARLFGVGAYLLDAPAIYTDWGSDPELRRKAEAEAFAQFRRWYIQRFGGAPNTSVQAPAQPASERAPLTRAERSTGEAQTPHRDELPPAAEASVSDEYNPATDARALTPSIWREQLGPALMRAYGYGALAHAGNVLIKSLREFNVILEGESWAALYALGLPVRRAWQVVADHEALKAREAANAAQTTEQPQVAEQPQAAEQPQIVEQPALFAPRPWLSEVDAPRRRASRRLVGG